MAQLTNTLDTQRGNAMVHITSTLDTQNLKEHCNGIVYKHPGYTESQGALQWYTHAGYTSQGALQWYS